MTRTLHPHALDVAIIVYVLDRHPAPVHRDDLARAFPDDDWASSVTALQADGILHREGALHLATGAAIRMNQLLT